jgi:hypothetical protein
MGKVTWAGMIPFTPLPTDKITVGQNADGRLDVFINPWLQAFLRKYQTSPNCCWSDWITRSGSHDPVILRAEEYWGMLNHILTSNADGRLELFFLKHRRSNNDIEIWHTWQTAPNSGWNRGPDGN